MRIRRRSILFLAGLAAALAAPVAAAAVPMNTLKVVDLNGNLLTDLDGNPTIVTFAESTIPGTSVTFGFELVLPDIVQFSTAGLVQLIESPPNPIPVTNPAKISDVVLAQLFRSTQTAPALLSISMRAHTPGPRPENDCQVIGPATCVVETGGFQDITQQLFPGHFPNLSFRVLVQSDLQVPEPGTLALVGVGLAGLAAVGRRRAS
jgi:hypothetical protein